MGTSADRIAPEKEAWFPNLSASEYKKTSDADPNYNCVAWVDQDTKYWWESGGEPGMFWPDQVPKGILLFNYLQLFSWMGFEICENSNPEHGIEKIAVYSDEAGIFFKHVSRQLADGNWTSKLGPEEDISHKSLTALCGSNYGIISKIMKRKAVY